MSGTEKLIERIIVEAQQSAEQTLEAANEKAARIRTDGRNSALKIKTEGEAKSKQEETDIVFRAKKNAELEAKKNNLAMRHSVIDEAFEAALNAMFSMDSADTFELLKQVMFKECTGGERVLPSKKHFDLLRDVVAEINGMLSSEGSAELTLLDSTDDIDSGFMLVGQGYEKPCTYGELLSDVREKHLGEIANILF